MESLLGNLKVLDFTTLLPGPFATMALADMGAEVVRVEAPGRPDMMRSVPPFDSGGNSAWHSSLNRSKRSLCLDLKVSGATDVVKRLVATHDIIVEQFRPGVMERLGLGYEALKAVNNSIIYCSITGYGQSGPWKNRAGHDNNYLATAGIMGVSGRNSERPPIFGVQVADVAGGSYGALTGILAAVIHRMATGKGQYIDISMLDAMVHMNMLNISRYLVSGDEPVKEDGLLNGGSFYDFYRTSDGSGLSIGSLEVKFRRGLARALGLEALEEKLTSGGHKADEAFKIAVAEVIESRTLEHWKQVFEKLDVCVEPVLSVSETVHHPQIEARAMIQDVPLPGGGVQAQVAFPYKFSGVEIRYRHAGLAAGQNTTEILEEVGYSREEIAEMAAGKLFGEPR